MRESAMNKPIRYCAACLDRCDDEYCPFHVARINRSNAEYPAILELRAREARLAQEEQKCR